MPKSSSKKQSSKSAQVEEVAPVKVEEVEEVAPVKVEEVAPVKVEEPSQTSDVTFEQRSKKILDSLSLAIQTLRTIQGEARQLQRDYAKSLREASKSKRRVKKTDGTKRKPSGFAKPTPITNQLANFLNVPEGSEMARTEVTKKLTAYIKEHNLQNPANKREINPDTNLRKLLLVPKEDKLTFFNLQKYMKYHFTKHPEVAA
jgi:chromatin remodeling complex protein RSC6